MNPNLSNGTRAGNVGGIVHFDAFSLPIFSLHQFTMKIVALSCLLASASAFAPAAQQRSSTALNYDINTAFGVTPETGNKCPPLGAMLLQDTDEKALKWFQNAEIKNGRVKFS